MNKGTSEGIQEEIALVKKMNSDKGDPFWKTLGMGDPECLFLVHVTEEVSSSVVGRKIKPKADVYVVRGAVERGILIKNGFYIKDSDEKDLKVERVDFSGISVKRIDSGKYQICKMNPNTFKKVFGSYELGAGASVYCTNGSELDKNRSVLAGWNTTWSNFKRYFHFIKGIESFWDESADINLRKQVALAIKKWCNEKIEEMIRTDSSISDFVFKGIGTPEPYTATWFYEKGVLKKAGLIPFCVTTGSGRSRGNFTVVIKPR